MQETSILSTFAATLFALLNPLGMLPVFIGYTAGMSIGVQRWLALFVSMTVLGLMLLFLLTGTAILDFFGITLDSFRMAGGILLLLIGIHIVMDDPTKAAKDLVIEAKTSDLSEAKSVYRQIVVPFAMPLLVGPGVIANLILYASQARAIRKRCPVFRTGGSDDSHFPADVRDSRRGPSLATTVGRCRPEHRHPHSGLAGGLHRHAIHY